MATLIEPTELPESFAPLISGYCWQRVTIGESEAHVFQLTRTGEPPRYLKVVGRGAAAELAAEAHRLEWLAAWLSVPRVLAFAEDDERAYLLMSAVPGVDAATLAELGDPERLVRLLAAGLRTIHALPVEGCPFDQRLDAEIASARLRMQHGLVDEDDFDTARQGRRAADLFAELLATRPSEDEWVFTHGDYCLPNVLIDDEQIGGFVDLGRAGVGDRYRDLALAARSITGNIGAHWTRLFFHEYGISEPDTARLEFFQLLDEFF